MITSDTEYIASVVQLRKLVEKIGRMEKMVNSPNAGLFAIAELEVLRGEASSLDEQLLEYETVINDK